MKACSGGNTFTRSACLLVMPLEVTRTPLHCSGSTEASSRMVGKVNVSRSSAEPKQSPPPVMFSQQKGMMLQSRCPCRPPHPSTRRSRPAEVGHHQPLLVSGVFLRDRHRLLPLWTLLLSQCFLSAAAFFLSSSFCLFSAFNLRSDIASSFSVKCRPAPSSVPFHKDED
ncbi:hypothetical protein GWK47_038237 [Chionoecetes opilio]|uniref:Transmembrane protein n=1 Tax=Chionoecetes opilio TaxID=41210 RepID=A0A8J4YCV7_CHIOP|nr:hypothetical protein GWK47_038237 [Chionoecetes opilio]